MSVANTAFASNEVMIELENDAVNEALLTYHDVIWGQVISHRHCWPEERDLVVFVTVLPVGTTVDVCTRRKAIEAVEIAGCYEHVVFLLRHALPGDSLHIVYAAPGIDAICRPVPGGRVVSSKGGDA